MSCNIILIDCGHENDNYLQEIRRAAPIQMDDSGYTYAGDTVQGEYCIMQVIKNPFVSETSILYIRANNPAFLQKNLFTRQPILPTYASGYHPYWNNDALIFTSKGYYRIIEFGQEIIR